MSNFNFFNALNCNFSTGVFSSSGFSASGFSSSGFSASGFNGALYAIFSFFEEQILPTARAISQKLDLYFISLSVFAAAIIIGGISMLIRVCLPKARKVSCAKLLLFFSFCFFLDLLICFCELNFCGKYLKTAAEAYIFCFLKFAVLLILYFMLAAENSILKQLDKKADESDVSAPRRVIYETPAPPLNAPKNDGAASDFECTPRYFSYIKSENAKKPARPDLNLGYIFALCDGLKKQPLTQTERERITDLELRLKTNDFATPKQTEILNEELRWLIKKAALYEYNLSV